MNRNDLLSGGIKPHNYCLPVLKRSIHQQAVLNAAVSGNPKFFLGTDSAPHLRQEKESACGCAGVYSAATAIELYAEIFEKNNALDKLEDFSSTFGADFYQLPRNKTKLKLIKKIKQEGLFITDEKRLKSILANIVSNSIKYADLEKTNPNINIEIFADKNSAEIIIADNGIGIEQEMQSKIFNMFYRANATEPGTGLGLYIAKETIEVLNGTIKIDSTLGDGTTCIINLVSLDKA